LEQHKREKDATGGIPGSSEGYRPELTAQAEELRIQKGWHGSRRYAARRYPPYGRLGCAAPPALFQQVVSAGRGSLRSRVRKITKGDPLESYSSSEEKPLKQVLDRTERLFQQAG